MYPGQVTRLSSRTKASALVLAADYDVIYLTGATAIATLQPRQLMGDQLLYLIPLDGSVATTSADNIIAARTMLQNTVTCFIYSRSSKKWYPHALA